MSKRCGLFVMMLSLACWHVARAQTLDTLVFGNSASEVAHTLTPGWGPVAPQSVVDANNGIYPSDPSLTPPSDVVTGGMGQSARRLLPRTPNPCVYGGEMSFAMAVDPVRQNHLTIKLWGSDTSSGIWFVLNVDGKELGLRHGGDSSAPDMLFGNKQIVTFAPNQWVYRTMALPIHLTQGKTSVSLKIRSMGWISDYDAGPFFGDYNKLMNSSSLGLYRIYTHLGSKLDTSGEAQGSGFTPVSPRTLENETTVVTNIKNAVNSELSKFMGYSVSSLKPWNLAWMAKCHDARENLGETWISYGGTNTAATLVQRVIDGIDYHVARQAADGGYFNSFGNDSWGGGFGPLGEAIRILWPQISAGTTMSTSVAYGGSYGTISRTSAWSKALRTSVDFGRYNRRGGGLYANQDIAGVEKTYNANRGLLLVDPVNALAESEAQRYLKEACGLLPWAGSDQTGGGAVPVKGTYPLGTSFYEVTSDGTTKDGGGFVGSDYGEMGSFIVRWGVVSGNNDILNRGLQMLRARATFRFPSFDGNGYRIMQGVNPIGVRNRTLPASNGYLDRGDGAPDIAALGTAVIGADLTGYFQNGITDGQQLSMMSGSKDPYLPRNWTLAKAQAATNIPVPMSLGAPDFAWGDEENMVVAAKSGENRIYVNLFWAATGSVNGWAKIFHLPANAAPEYSEVQIDDLRYRPRGTFQTLGRRVDSSTRQPFDNPESAYNGVVCPLAMRSDLASPPPNDPDGGKGTGYTLRYGHWLIGINAHHADSYQVLLPSNFSSALPIKELVSGNNVTTASVTLAPKTTAVFYLPDVVDPAPLPARPLMLTAKSTSSSVVLDWPDTPGGITYQVKRSTISGSGYTTIGSTGASSYVDTTASSGTTYYYVVSALNSAGGEGGNSIEASAALKSSGLVNRATGGAASSGLSSGSYPPANAFDGSNSSKWNSGSTGIAAWLQYDFGKNITWAVTRYDITSADTTMRDPKDWTFQGSNDGSIWTTLDARSGETFTSRAQTKQYTISNTTGYRYYRLNVTSASGGLGYEIQLAELGLYSSGPGTVTPPPAPTGLIANSGNNNVFLNWNSLGGANSYVVKRSTSAGGPFTTIGTTENSHFLDSAAPSTGTYHYVVAAMNSGGEGDVTLPANAFFGPTAAVAPTGLAAVNGPNAGQVTLRWDAAPGVPSYTLKRSTTSGGPYTTIASGIFDLNFTDTGLSNGVTYFYVVSATIAGVESANSGEVSITPQAFSWNGTTATWSTGSNWGGTAPGNGSLLIFGGTPAVTSSTNNLTALNTSGLVFNGGASSFTLSGNALTLGGDIINSATNTQTIGLGLTLSGNRNIDVRAGQLTISGSITDGSASYGITKSGGGTLALSGSNPFDGGLVINSGTLQVGTSTTSGASGATSSLGSAGGSVTLGAATLRFQMGSNSANTIPNNFLLNAGSILTTNDGKITLGSASNTITVNGSTLIQGRWSGKWFVLGGIVSGAGDISITNTTTSHMTAVGFTNGSNTYDGTITVEDTASGMAALAVGHDQALRFARINALNTQSGRYSVWFDTTAPVLGGLAGVPGSSIMLNTDGGIHGSGPSTGNSAVTLSVGYNNADSIYEGNLTGTGGLTKVGTGIFTLAGSNTYSGATTVNGGTLLLTSPLAGSGNTIVNNGGTLVGDTDLGGSLVVNTGGIISPDGVLGSNGLTLTNGAILALDLGTAATSDRIEMTGGSYSAPASGQAVLQLNVTQGFGPGLYQLVTGATGISAADFSIPIPPPSGYSYALSAADGTLSLTVTGPPAMPSGLLAYGYDGAVTLAWDVATGATSYTVYMSTLPDSGFAAVNTTTGTAYTISGLTNGTPQYFYITATNGFGEGAASEVATATPQINAWVATPASLDWSLASNWGGVAPVNHARLTFGSSSATNLNNDLTGLTVGGLVFNAGASAYTFSGNSILLTGDIANNSTSAQTINLQMTLVGDRTVTTNTGAVTLNGAIDDGGFSYGLIKNGTGTLTLNGSNSFTGGIAVNAGTLVLSGVSPLGAGEPVIMENGSTLQLSGANITSDLVVPSGATVNILKTNGSSYINGRLSGGGVINENTGGGTYPTMNWNNDNSGFTGSISSNGGSTHRWRFNTPESGSASASWNLNATTTDAYGFNFGVNGTISFGALSGSGYFRNNGNGSVTMRIGDLGTNTTMSGTTVFSIGLIKVGAGTLTLSGPNFFHTNPTTVSSGTLNVTGAIATSALTVENAATLSGTGTLGGSVTANTGGNLSPGNGGEGATGNLTLNNMFVPKSGSNLRFELGSSSDQITLGLTSGFTAPASGTVSIHLSAASGFSAGTYTLINNLGAGTLNPSAFSIGSLPPDYAATLALNGGSLEVTLRFTGADWSGTTSGIWSLASNWNGTAPIDGDKLSFTNSPNTNLSNDLSNLMVSGITFNSGASAYSISGNSIRLGGNIVNNSTASQSINLPIVLTSHITVTSNTGAISLGGVISESGGSFSITKNGTGALTLSGANTFSGGFTTTAGDTYISGFGSGTPGAPTSGALGTGVVTLAGGRIIYNSGNASLYNHMVAQAGTTTTFLEAANNTLYLYGDLSGSGNLIFDANKNYNGVHLAGDNSAFTGTITLTSTGNSARHKFDSANAGSAAAKWVLNGPTDSGSMNFGTGTIHFGEFSGNANQIRNNASGTATLSIGALNTDSTFTGVIGSTGSIALRKVGTGTLTLSGANSYSGATTVQNGTLKFTGNKTGTGAVTIQTGAILAGTAIVAGPLALESGGTLAPGNNGPGTLTFSGAFTLNAGGVLHMEIGTTSDQVVVNGAYTAPVGGPVTIDISAVSGFAPGTRTLISGATGISASGFAIGTAPAGYVYQLGASGGSLTLSITEAVIPAPPAGLSANGGVARIDLVWPAVSGADAYNVKRADQPGGPYTLIASQITATSFIDSGLPNGATRHYVVSAANIAGEGAHSNEASATTLSPPAAPNGLTANGGVKQITLAWSPVAGASSYTVKRAISPGGSYTIIAAGLTSAGHTDASLGDGQTYHYVISAANEAGEGAQSPEASASTYTALESWRFTNFGSTANTGDAADNGDFDHDGRVNLMEYATATDPKVANAGAVTALAILGDGRLTLTFRRIADPTLIYQVRASNDLSDWGVSPVWSSTGADNVEGMVTAMDASPPITSSRFLRLVVVHGN